MSQYVINIGALPNDGTGDPLRTAFNLVNLNFNQVFAAGPVGSNIKIVNNSITSTNTNGNIILAPNGVGSVNLAANMLPDYGNIRDIGSPERRIGTIYAQFANVVNWQLPDNLTANNIMATGNIRVQQNLYVIGNAYGNLQGDTTGTHTGYVYDMDIRYMSWDFGYIPVNKFDNPIQFVLHKTGNIDMGTITDPAYLQIDAGVF